MKKLLYGDSGFGRCVALNQGGNILAVGAWNVDVVGVGDNAGHAKVYGYNGSDWFQMGQTLTAYLAEDRFGWYVSLSDDGKTVAVSAKQGDPGNMGDAGYVRVFTYNGTSNNSTWLQLGKDLEGEAREDQFGKSVTLSADGRRLAVAAHKADGAKGRVRVFNYSGGSWGRIGQALVGDYEEDQLGTAVSLSTDGSVLAVSAEGTESETGTVRVYRLVNSTWTQMGENLTGEGVGDLFGGNFISLSGDGNCLAVGSNHYSSNRGKGYLFRWKDSQWKKIASVNGEIPGERLAFCPAVSGDCSWLAVGATEDDDMKVAPEGSSTKGYVLVFEVNE
jgi:hypothetical protein